MRGLLLLVAELAQRRHDLATDEGQRDEQRRQHHRGQREQHLDVVPVEPALEPAAAAVEQHERESDDDRRKYVAGLATVLKAGGELFLLCFSDEEPGDQGPRRISKQELHDAFGAGWAIESIQPVQVEVNPNLKDFAFSEGGPKAWFAVVRRG